MFGAKYIKFSRDLWVLLSSILIIHIAAYLIVPIFPILLKTEKNLSPTNIGIVIGAGSLFIQLGSILAGLLGNRVGNHWTLIIGNLCQAIALLGFGITSSFYILAFFSAMNGIGTGIYIPTIKAAISYVATEGQKTTAFSLRGVAAHGGTALAGILIFFTATNRNFYIASTIYILLMLGSWIFMPRDCGNQPCPTLTLRSYIGIFKDRHFLFFSLVSALIWSLHTQLGLLLPLRADTILKDNSPLGTIWTISSLSVILVQPYISKNLLEKKSLSTSITIGVILLGVGITIIGFSYSFYLLLISSLVFVLGEMFVMPVLDSITSKIADPSLIGVYFSVANFASGIGAALGNFTSGKLIDVYGIRQSLIPWFILGGFTILLAFIVQLPVIKMFTNSKPK